MKYEPRSRFVTVSNFQFKIMRFFFIISVAVLSIGCNGKNVPLSGIVTFSDDGSPLTVGSVVFETDTHQARGQLQSDGRYTMGFVGESDGLPPDTYRVYVHGADIPDPTVPNRGDGVPYIPLIDAKFAGGRSSGITVDVDKTAKTFDFSVDPDPKTKAKLAKTR